ncbi:MAG: hypothetical protein OEV78_02560 [Spirochaetia bacterium]|nr:hypothetical protein [Spirochaetia bacterium]
MAYMNESFNFNETEFQELFELYWNAAENSKSRMFVIEELNKYIYFYVTGQYQIEFDTASDFFVENIENTRKWLEEYEPSYLISFLVYFTSKIKRRLFNYKIKYSKLKRYENLHEFYDLNPDAFIESVFEERKDYQTDINEESHFNIRDFTKICLSDLKEDEQIAIKLYYGFPLSNKDFRYFIRRFSLKSVFQNYRKYHDYLKHKLNTERAQREVISQKLYLTSIFMRDEANQKIMDRRERLLTYFAEVKNLVPLRLIAEVFQTNITSVHRKIKRGQLKLKMLLGDQLFFNFSLNEHPIKNTNSCNRAA